MTRGYKKKKKDFFDSVDESVLTLRDPACEHVPLCGGCRFQHITYESQLQLKKAYLQELFGKPVDLVAAPVELEYRNRMDFVYAFGKLGLRKRGDFKEVVEINNCLLLPKQARDMVTRVKTLLAVHEIPSYDFLAHAGFLRYVTIRYAPSTGESMLIFTSSTPAPEQELTFINFINGLTNEITSIYWFINDTITDVSIPQNAPYKTFGKESITERIGDINLMYGPQSFFQVNAAVAQTMFAEINNHVVGNTIDICCGVGAITLFVANKAKSIIGIEEISEAIVIAKQNALLNNKNAFFFCTDMKNFAEYAPLDSNTIILDPPRAGIGKKVALRILQAQPQTIIYMSCNPKTQKEDLHYFLTEYEEVFFQGYDMFPQTNHVETLLVLKRK